MARVTNDKGLIECVVAAEDTTMTGPPIGGSGTDEAGEIDPSGYTDTNGNLVCKAYS